MSASHEDWNKHPLSLPCKILQASLLSISHIHTHTQTYMDRLLHLFLHPHKMSRPYRPAGSTAGGAGCFYVGRGVGIRPCITSRKSDCSFAVGLTAFRVLISRKTGLLQLHQHLKTRHCNQLTTCCLKKYLQVILTLWHFSCCSLFLPCSWWGLDSVSWLQSHCNLVAQLCVPVSLLGAKTPAFLTLVIRILLPEPQGHRHSLSVHLSIAPLNVTLSHLCNSSSSYIGLSLSMMVFFPDTSQAPSSNTNLLYIWLYLVCLLLVFIWWWQYNCH